MADDHQAVIAEVREDYRSVLAVLENMPGDDVQYFATVEALDRLWAALASLTQQLQDAETALRSENERANALGGIVLQCIAAGHVTSTAAALAAAGTGEA